MRWPWQKLSEAPAEPAAETVDIAAVARQAAQEAVREIAPEIARAMITSSPMLGAPDPQNTAGHALYAMDNPIWFSTPQAPTRRPGSMVTTSQLRNFADNYDVLRSCIQHLKREVTAVPLRIVAKDAKANKDATAARIAEAERHFGIAGVLGGPGKMRGDFESKCIEDLSVIGAAAVYYAPTRGGAPYDVDAIDAATIRPVVDAYGWPSNGGDWYEQWIQGIKVAGFTPEQMTYSGLPTNARSYTPFYASQVEWLIFVILSALKADEWNRSWLTDGNTPSDLIALPEAWTPEMIKSFAGYFDKMLSGDSRERIKTKFVPGGSQRVGNPSRKDQDFQVFELWLLRRTCAIMGVQPASIGFAGEQYKVSQEDSMESTSAFGVGVILTWFKALYDDLLLRLGYNDLECQHVTAREEKAAERATRNAALVSGGIITPNEARADEGKDPIEGGDQLFLQGTLRTIEQIINPPEPPAPVTEPGAAKPPKEDPPADDTQRVALSQWERKAINRMKAGKGAAATFTSAVIPRGIKAHIEQRLPNCTSIEAVRALFRDAGEMDEEDAHERTDWAARVTAELEALAGAG